MEGTYSDKWIRNKLSIYEYKTLSPDDLVTDARTIYDDDWTLDDVETAVAEFNQLACHYRSPGEAGTSCGQLAHLLTPKNGVMVSLITKYNSWIGYDDDHNEGIPALGATSIRVSNPSKEIMNMLRNHRKITIKYYLGSLEHTFVLFYIKGVVYIVDSYFHTRDAEIRVFNWDQFAENIDNAPDFNAEPQRWPEYYDYMTSMWCYIFNCDLDSQLMITHKNFFRNDIINKIRLEVIIPWPIGDKSLPLDDYII